jgi:hypothetical protein
MNHQLLQYIEFARKHKMEDGDIRANLVSAGWDGEQVDAALEADGKALLMPPPPPAPAGSSALVGGVIATPSGTPATPIAVVQQRTTKGLEYTIMFVALGASAISLGALLHNTVDSSFGGQGSTDLVSFAASALIVALPIFIVLFLRLKKAELVTPAIRSDASRRHAVQFTLIVSFVWGLFRLITYIYSLLNSGSGSSTFLGSDNSSPIANLLHTLITLAIAGAIFAYYWLDEHRKDQV